MLGKPGTERGTLRKPSCANHRIRSVSGIVLREIHPALSPQSSRSLCEEESGIEQERFSSEGGCETASQGEGAPQHHGTRKTGVLRAYICSRIGSQVGDLV